MNVVLSKLLVFWFGVMALASIFLFESLVSIVAIIYLYVAVVVGVNCKNGAADPRVFPLSFMAVYFTFFPLRAYFFGAGNLPYDETVLIASLKLQFLAIFVFVSVSNIFISNARQENENLFSAACYKNTTSEQVLFVCVLPFVIVPVLMILNSGASSKREILAVFSFAKFISDFGLLVITVLVFFRAVRIGRLFYLDLGVLLYVLFCLFYVLLTGERDILFKVIFGFLIIYFDQRRSFSFVKMLGIFGGLVFVVPVSQYFKGVLLSGGVNFDRVGWDLILYSEFMSASRNFYSLLVFDAQQDLTFLIQDIMRAFVPSILVGDTGVQSSVSWFENVFRPEHGFEGTSGWGFTIVGFGYIVGGIGGIILIMTFYAWLLAVLYSYRWASLYWYSFYILALAAFVYVLRADLANLLSMLFKISGLSVLIIYFFHGLIKKHNYIKRI
ncbi:MULTISPECIES: hypothetical protein [Pseudomonas]|uniref:hypothetical protein n=1 Tax=Pseudomonas TaxID=286 RepID=UPI00209B6E26|nr:hypothetical protein [Pseudomonas guariconensis]MCO7622419.1 hypothetical protein [Pseudomonas guariconensis]